MRKVVLGLGTLLLLGARFLLGRASEAGQGEIRDALTGLLTQGVMDEIYTAELKRSTRTGVPFSLLLVEAEGFGNMARAHGRRGTERVLTAIGESLRQSVRASDYVGRYGRSRFMVILPETWSDDLTTILLRLRQPITCQLPDAKEALVINARVGTATWEPGMADLITVAQNRLTHGPRPSN
ncbi:MAG: GGDEF domain-containing protein [Armatimonadetes bacterium]|nr:GGDEF domain-containing protein [Armatimonadota bacterium]